MELLKQLYSIHSMSGQEKKMRRFIRRNVSRIAPDAVIYQDNKNNLYVTKGEPVAGYYPCIASHMDQVQRQHSKDFTVGETEHILLGYSPSKREQEGLGADDKNGIWVALKCLEKFDSLKLCFFVEEEIGCGGSEEADMDWFEDVGYVLQIDRRGAHDLITNIMGDICTDEFAEALNPGAFGYKPTNGMMTDIEALMGKGLKCSAVNMSCGYYSPHTDEEYTVKADLLNCLAFVENIITNVKGFWKAPEQKEYEGSYSFYGGYLLKRWGDYYDGYMGTRGESEGDIDVVYEPELFDRNDYADWESFVEDTIWYNYGFSADRLWQYIQADLESDGVTYDMYRDKAIEVMQDMY